MSLRLRILLLIAAVNVAVLLFVVWLGLEATRSADLVGPAALEEAWRIAYSDAPKDFPRHAVSFLVRKGGPDPDEPAVIVAPPHLLEKANAAKDRLLELRDRGQAVYQLDRNGLTVVYDSPDVEWHAYYVGFNERATQEAIQSLRTIYVLLSGGTILLIGGTYLILRRLVLQPLERLARASQQVAHGQRAEPIPVRGQDEVARLIETFNRMAVEVHEYQAHLEERVMDALGRVSAAENRLVVAQRLSATGTLAAGFAHEINNPLGGILNALRKLREGELSEERREEYFELIFDGLDRIRTIVDRILHFTPRQREPLTIDVADVCRRAAALADHRAGQRGVELSRPADDAAGPHIVGDQQELTQAVLNLILNAVDAIPEDRGGAVSVQAREEAGEAVLEVTDDGLGMDPDTVARCVDFFFSTKPEGEGTGLGLAIVQHIVTDHGGRLEIESEEGRGTTVRVRLPRETAA